MNEAANICADISDDAFLGGALNILQPKRGYRAGLDAVLLAAAAPVNAGASESVLDVGAGVGVVGLAVARRIGDAQVCLIERDPALASLARRNAERNGLADRAQVIEADVVQRLNEPPDLGRHAERFDHALANPPYHAEGDGTASGDAGKAASNAMPEADLARWLKFMAAMARPGGSATLIHKAEGLPHLLAALSGRFGALKLLPIHHRAEQPAIRIIVQGIKASRSPLQLRPPLILHGDGDGFQPQLEAILRHGAPLTV